MRNLFLENRFFYLTAAVCICYLCGFFISVFAVLGNVLLLLLLTAAAADAVLLFVPSAGIEARRRVPNKLSNGDENLIELTISGNYSFPVSIRVIDEVPVQFELRDFTLNAQLTPRQPVAFSYSLRPVRRGEYTFGNTVVYVRTALGLLSRRFIKPAEIMVPVYPSFIQMRKFELHAVTNRFSGTGIKKIRKVGHTMEFDQISEYVPGDDIRSLNWKATSRAGQLMVNRYRDERSQQIISAVDTGRVMKMPFNGMQLLEYAINTTLVISNIALLKEDKAGLLTFSDSRTNIVKPESRRTHLKKIQEALYNVATNFLESNFEDLLLKLRKHISGRSLILLYTNFETYSAMERQLPYLQQLAKEHLLVVIFFENTELTALQARPADSIREIYTKTAAENIIFEKRKIVKALKQRGIHAILTPPEELSVQTINKYLELKSRGLI